MEISKLIKNLVTDASLWKILIANLSGSVLAYLFNYKLQLRKEQKDTTEKEQKKKEDQFLKIKMMWLTLERNSLSLSTALVSLDPKNYSKELQKEKSLELIVLEMTLDTTDYYKELMPFVPTSLIKSLLLLHNFYEDLKYQRKMIQEVKSQFIIGSVTRSLDTSDFTLEEILKAYKQGLKENCKAILFLTKHIVSQIERDLKKYFPDLRLSEVNWNEIFKILG